MASVVTLLLLVFYVFAVTATKMFGAAFPAWFGSLGASMYSLFQIMTPESWSMGIVRPVMQDFPHAWAFFVPFILVTSFVVLNLFIAVIVNTMQAQRLAGHVAEDAEAAQVNHRRTARIEAELAGLCRDVQDLKALLEGRRET